MNTQYALFLSGGAVVFRLIKVPGVDHRTIGSDSQIPLNTWTHVAATWDGTTMKLFVNGVQQTQTLGVAAPINGGDGPTLIGKQGSNINHFAGLIDEVEIFDTLEIISAAQKVFVIGVALGASYLITILVPRYALQLQYAGTALVLAAVVAVLRQRRSRKKRRGAIRRERVESVLGAEA